MAGSGGFDKVVFTISVNGATVATETVNSLAGLASFNDSVIDLGARADSTALLFDLSVAYTSTGGGDAFDGNIIVGNAAAQGAQSAAVPEVREEARFNAQPQFVPEPSTWAMVFVGAAALGLFRRRSRRN